MNKINMNSEESKKNVKVKHWYLIILYNEKTKKKMSK